MSNLSTLKVYSAFAYTTMQESLAQQTALFNAATRGALVLRSKSNQGDYSDEVFFQRISGLVRRRDAYGSGSISSTELTQLASTSVKVASGTKLVRIDPSQFKWIMQSPEQAGIKLGQQLAEDRLAEMLNTALLAQVAALSGVAALVKDGTAAVASLAALNSTAAKFGDRAANIAAWIMHSKVLHDIYGESLTNTAKLFVFGNVQVAQDGFGRPLIMTDSDNLFVADGVSSGIDKYYTLGLQPAATLVDDNNDFTDATVEGVGYENISRSYQAEWSYNLGLKGFAWDKTNGGESPNNAALGTASNWDKVVTSVKDCGGVLLSSR